MKKYPALCATVSLFTCASQKELSPQEGLTRGGTVRPRPLIRTTIWCKIVRLSSEIKTKINILKSYCFQREGTQIGDRVSCSGTQQQVEKCCGVDGLRVT